MKVWTLQMGENCEGAYRTVLCATYAIAKRLADEWIQESTWADEWKWDGDFVAGGGCDWIAITEVEVRTE